MSTIITRSGKGSPLTSTEVDTNFTNLNTDKLQDIVADTTPQLGGNLDVNGKSIISVSNGNIVVTPNGTGKVVLDGLSWPTADGTANQVLKTDGAGNLAFSTPSAGGNNIIEISTGDTRMVMPSTVANTTSTFVAESTGGVSGVSVSGSTFTLPAGTYIMDFPFSTASSTSFYSDLYLWNTGNNTSLLTIAGNNMDQNNALYWRWSGKFKFTLASSTTLSFRNEGAPGTGYNVVIGAKQSQVNGLFSITFNKIA